MVEIKQDIVNMDNQRRTSPSPADARAAPSKSCRKRSEVTGSAMHSKIRVLRHRNAGIDNNSDYDSLRAFRTFRTTRTGQDKDKAGQGQGRTRQGRTRWD